MKPTFSHTDRYVDLMRQGFMKPLRQPEAKTALPTVACTHCKDWHRKSKHTQPGPYPRNCQQILGAT